MRLGDLCTENTECCTPENGFGAAAGPQQKPPAKPHSLGESAQCPEMAQSPRTWGKGFTRGMILLVLGVCHSLGWAQWDKPGCLGWRRRRSLFHRVRAHPVERHQARKPREHRDPAGWDPSWQDTHRANTPLTASLLGLAVPGRAKRCKAFAGLTRSLVITKTENPGLRASPADFSLPVPFQCSTGDRRESWLGLRLAALLPPSLSNHLLPSPQGHLVRTFWWRGHPCP